MAVSRFLAAAEIYGNILTTGNRTASSQCLEKYQAEYGNLLYDLLNVQVEQDMRKTAEKLIEFWKQEFGDPEKPRYKQQQQPSAKPETQAS